VRSVPLPKGCDRLVDPSDRFVIVPEPGDFISDSPEGEHRTAAPVCE
jgi:hypothetical protein